MRRLVVRVVGYAFLFGIVGVSIGYRFANPTLTETQLFLALWPLTLLSLVGIVLVVYGETSP